VKWYFPDCAACFSGLVQAMNSESHRQLELSGYFQQQKQLLAWCQ